MSLVASTRTALPDRDRARMVDLQDKVDELQEHIRQLEDAFAPRQHLPEAWKLTPGETRVFEMLLARDLVTRPQLVVLIRTRVVGGDSLNVAQVYIHRVRRKLTGYGVQIENIYGCGWRLIARHAWKAKIASWQTTSEHTGVDL